MHQGEPYRGSDGQMYTVWRAGAGDTSPIHFMYPHGYSAKCGACYLGHSHSEAYHQEQVNQGGNYWSGSSGWQPRGNPQGDTCLCWSCHGRLSTADATGRPITCRVCDGTGYAVSSPTPASGPLRKRGPGRLNPHLAIPRGAVVTRTTTVRTVKRPKAKNPRERGRCGPGEGGFDDFIAGRKPPVPHPTLAQIIAQRCPGEYCNAKPGQPCATSWQGVLPDPHPVRRSAAQYPAKRRQKNPKHPNKKIHALAQVVNNLPVASCGARQGLVSADPHAITCKGCRQRGIAKNARQLAAKCANPRRRRR